MPDDIPIYKNLADLRSRVSGYSTVGAPREVRPDRGFFATLVGYFWENATDLDNEMKAYIGRVAGANAGVVVNISPQNYPIVQPISITRPRRVEINENPPAPPAAPVVPLVAPAPAGAPAPGRVRPVP